MSLARALEGEVEKLSHCVHCGFCLPACPTYTRLGDEADSPRGRLYLMRAVVEGRLDPGSDAFQTHIDRCLGCRACEPVCPSGVEYGHLLERAREAAAEARRPPATARVLLAVLGRPAAERVFLVLSRLLRATRLPALAARLLPDRGVSGRLRLAMGMLAASAPVRIDGGAGRKIGERDDGGRRDEAAEESRRPGERGRIGLLTGCVQEGLFDRVNRATARVLEANGYEVVEVAGQGCCGALHAHGGALDRARELAARNVDAFRSAGVDRVAVNAAGCGATVKEYGDLLEDDPERAAGARELAAGARDVSELLAAAGPRTGGPLPLRVAYDAPCHLVHGQGVEEEPLRVLSAIPGLERVPLRRAEECCGGAGIYGLTHPELGGRVGSDKVEAIRDCGAEVVVTGNPGCIMQIGAGVRRAGLGVGVLHPVELLDESYRRAGFYRSGARHGGGGQADRAGTRSTGGGGP